MLIVVDANSVAHREKHTMGDLSYNDKKVGVIFGFFRQILRLSKIFKANKFAFCWDSKSSNRKLIYSEYKSNRRKEKTPEEIELDEIAYSQFDLLKNELLPSIGFNNVFEEDHFESDDLIASIVLSKRKTNQEIIIVSSDNDMYQLLDKDRAKLYDLGKKRLYTEEDFKEEHGIEVNKWVMVKALAGCHSDNIKGVKGIGEKTAIKYIKGELSREGKAYKSIVSQEGRNILMTNLELVIIPFPDTPFLTLKKDKFIFKEFTYMCEKHGFRSFLKKELLLEWKERFDMK